MMTGAALLRYGDASNFEISDSLLRPIPSSSQVLVNIHSSSVNPIKSLIPIGVGSVYPDVISIFNSAFTFTM